MINTTAGVIASQAAPSAQLRTGTVASATGGTAIVVVGSTVINASIIIPFGVANPSAAVPAPGDLVMVGRQDSSWAVLGSILGASGNLIINGSFEESPAGSPPANWTLYQITNSSVATVTTSDPTVAGDAAALVQTDTTPAVATSYLYSSPVPVGVGETFQLSAFVAALYANGVAEDADAALYALWFATETALYPTTSSADTLVASATDVTRAPYTPLTGQVVAPVDGFMRLALRSSITASQSLLYDFAVVRRFS